MRNFSPKQDGWTRVSSNYGTRKNCGLISPTNRGMILSEEDVFRVDETWLKRQAPPSHGPTVALTNTLQQQEREMIEAALAESGGYVSGPGGAAARLGIPRPTLDAKIKRLGINKYQFKGRSA